MGEERVREERVREDKVSDKMVRGKREDRSSSYYEYHSCLPAPEYFVSILITSALFLQFKLSSLSIIAAMVSPSTRGYKRRAEVIRGYTSVYEKRRW